MTTEIKTPEYTDSQIMMTLSAIAYATDSTGNPIISTELAKPCYATTGDWKSVWGPVYMDSWNFQTGNLMYVAQQNNTNNYAVVLRGTVHSFDLSTLMDIFEDLAASVQTLWPDGNVYSSYISYGSYLGLVILQDMTYSGQTLLQFLKSTKLDKLFVTGHSLGGCLVTVLATWLNEQIIDTNIYPYTFAAPTAGNSGFADKYNNLFENSYRFYNAIDVIPNSWATLSTINSLFPGGPAYPWAMNVLIGASTEWLEITGCNYTQTNNAGTQLNGISSQNNDWFEEALNQHHPNTYLQLLGAPQLDSNIFLTIKTKPHNKVLMQHEKPFKL